MGVTLDSGIVLKIFLRVGLFRRFHIVRCRIGKGIRSVTNARQAIPDGSSLEYTWVPDLIWSNLWKNRQVKQKQTLVAVDLANQAIVSLPDYAGPLGLYWTGLTLLSGFSFLVIFFLFWDVR